MSTEQQSPGPEQAALTPEEIRERLSAGRHIADEDVRALLAEIDELRAEVDSAQQITLDVMRERDEAEDHAGKLAGQLRAVLGEVDELRYVFACDCHEDFTGRGLHAPNTFCGDDENLRRECEESRALLDRHDARRDERAAKEGA